MLSVGDVLDGSYRIISRIGDGGAGVVFLGYHLRLNKYVVVKKLKEEAGRYLNIRREADILKQLHHPYLPQVYDFLMVDGEIFTVMDYVDGHDLKWYVEKGIAFSEQELFRMLIQLCQVLEYLHGQIPPVIHRDIKPGNIMIRENGDVCLIDFNISSSDGRENISGYSYHYAPPEQLEMIRNRACDGQAVLLDARSDIYSLGATFFYVATGIHPRDCSSEEQARALKETAYASSLLRVIQKAMSRKPEKRYASAGQMRKALERGRNRIWRICRGLAVSGISLAVILGAAAGMLHIRNKKEEAFAAAYMEYVDLRASGDTQAWIKEGIALLNRTEFAAQFWEKPAQKAVVLEGIADGYYEEGSYEEASGYYEEALSLRTDPAKETEDARDLILALIRSGEAEEAQRKLEIYQAALPSDTLSYVEVEFLVQEGRREEALEQIDSLLCTAEDREICLRCCLYGAECLEGTEEYGKRLAYLERAEQYVDTVLVYRRIGDGYLKLAQEETDGEVREKALDSTVRCYERLYAQANAGYVDRLNYAVVLQLKEKYQEAREVLEQLIREFPEDYRAYREAAFACYGLELKKAAQYRSWSPVLYYGGLAFQYYKEEFGDEQMVRLEELLDQLSA